MINYTLKKATTFEEAIKNLYEIVTLLRSPEGCPWDKEQTTKSLIPSLMGEMFEYMDAVEQNDTTEQGEEIGDILLNLTLLLRIHEENNDFNPTDSINECCEKLIRRHPHVFSNESVNNASEVINLWNNIKKNVEKREEHTQEDFFSKIPKSTYPLEEAYDIQKKLNKIGFEFPDLDSVYSKVIEELNELRNASTQDNIEEEIGDLLFAVINLSRYYKVKPTMALKRSNNKIRNRFNQVFKLCKERNIELTQENMKLMDKIWDEVKQKEKGF